MAYNINQGEAKHTQVFTTITQDEDLESAANAGPCEGLFCRWIDVATGGTLVVVNPDGSEKTLPAFPDGHRFFGQYKGIVLTGTTAAGVVVYW